MSTPKNPAAADRSSPAIEHIHVARNVRDLCEEHVAMLAESIKLVGVLQPLIVRPTAEGYELVAGFHRLAAARKLRLSEVPVVLRDAELARAAKRVRRVRAGHVLAAAGDA